MYSYFKLIKFFLSSKKNVYLDKYKITHKFKRVYTQISQSPNLCFTLNYVKILLEAAASTSRLARGN